MITDQFHNFHLKAGLVSTTQSFYTAVTNSSFDFSTVDWNDGSLFYIKKISCSDCFVFVSKEHFVFVKGGDWGSKILRQGQSKLRIYR